jgi:hypothetical protein
LPKSRSRCIPAHPAASSNVCLPEVCRRQ